MEREVKLLREENRLLKEKVKFFEEEIKPLDEKLERALKRIEELEGVLKMKSKPVFVKEEVSHYHHKSGLKQGHEGYSRHVPERVDYVKKAVIHNCPDCSSRLSRVQELRARYVEDIPITGTVVTKYLIERRYCRKCKRIVEAVVNEALPNARFGLRLMILIAYLKIGLRLPSNKIIEFMKINHGLIISDGEIYQVLNRLSKELGPYYNILKKKITQAKVKHIDETGWRINGNNHWLWTFINKEIAFYTINKQRSSKVPIKILGNQEGSVFISDRHPAYNQLSKKSKCKQQVCWAHILRDSKKLSEHNKEGEYIHKKLKNIYKKANAYNHKATNEQAQQLIKKAELLAKKPYKHNQVYKFIKSVCVKHREDLFRFTTNPLIESTNNPAERALRHAVIIRKISNGSKTHKGANTTSKLLSITETIKKQTQNPLTEMLNLLQKTK